MIGSSVLHSAPICPADRPRATPVASVRIYAIRSSMRPKLANGTKFTERASTWSAVTRVLYARLTPSECYLLKRQCIHRAGRVCLYAEPESFGASQATVTEMTCLAMLTTKYQTPPTVRCCPLVSQFEYASRSQIRFAIWRRVAYSWPSRKHDVIHQTGSTQRIATPPEEDRARKFGKFGRQVPEIWSRQTDRHADRDTLLATGGGVITSRRASSASWNSVHSVCVCVCWRNNECMAVCAAGAGL